MLAKRETLLEKPHLCAPGWLPIPRVGVPQSAIGQKEKVGKVRVGKNNVKQSSASPEGKYNVDSYRIGTRWLGMRVYVPAESICLE